MPTGSSGTYDRAIVFTSVGCRVPSYNGYCLALIAVGVATVVRGALDPWLQGYFPLAYLLAVAVVATYARLGPAVLSMVLGGLLADWLFISEDGKLWVVDLQHLADLGLYYVSSLMLITLAMNLQRSRSRLQRSEAELEVQAARLQAADERKDRLIALMSHELRNPLASIANAVAVMRLTVNDRSDVTGAAIEIVERQSQQLKYLVDEMLDTARIRTGRIVLDCKPIELTEVIRHCVDSIRPRCAQAGITLSLDTSNESLWLHGDRGRLAQILDNLLDNACKYTSSGGCIHVAVRRDHGECLVSVQDDGIGIDEVSLTAIFDAFQKAATAECDVGGLGLGLHLVKRLVEQHGGVVEAKSQGAGQGSEFTIRLPLIRQPSAEVRTIPARKAVAAQRRILVVDDNADAAQMLQLLLELTGHEVCVAFSGADGIALAEQCMPDVAFVDLSMPGIDGYEVARRLRQRFGSCLRLVAVSGFSLEEHQERSRQAGFDEHLVKPPSPEAIGKAIAAVPAAASQAPVRRLSKV
jgi:signal transduction histidine kinase/ActR/RegA family two-component response regulator